MPKPEDTISPTAIVQALGGKGITSTFLFKKIARHHRTRLIRPMDDVVKDVIDMKRDIYRRAKGHEYERLEDAYRYFMRRMEKKTLANNTRYTGYTIRFREKALLKRFNVCVDRFKEYFDAQNPNCPYDVSTPPAIDWAKSADPGEKSIRVSVKRRTHPECFVENH